MEDLLGDTNAAAAPVVADAGFDIDPSATLDSTAPIVDNTDATMVADSGAAAIGGGGGDFGAFDNGEADDGFGSTTVIDSSASTAAPTNGLFDESNGISEVTMNEGGEGVVADDDAQATVDYYTSNDAGMDAAMAIPEGPIPGHFESDGTYVPPSDKTEEAAFDNIDTSALDAWDSQHKAALQQADSEELAAIQARESDAEKELAQFNEERTKRIAQTQANNKVEEQQFIANRDAPVDAKNLWDRVTQLVDVSKPSENADVARFRSLLLQLKHNPL